MSVFFIVFVCLVLISVAVLIGVSLYFIRFMTKPAIMTEEKSREDEIANGTWKPLDGVSSEEWNITTRNGYVLSGTVIPAEVPVDRWIIITHGWTNRRSGSLKYVHLFHNMGFNCYIYDLRNHGVNVPSWTSMGPEESRDIVDIAAALRSRFGASISIGLHGESLGSASSVLALRLTGIGKNESFSFLISDCGYASLADLMTDLCTRVYHLPAVFAWTSSTINCLLHGYRLFSVEPYKALQSTATPVLFIHGTDDDFILPSNAEKMYHTLKDRTNAPFTDLYLCPGAKHALSYATNQQEYELRVRQFLHTINVL